MSGERVFSPLVVAGAEHLSRLVREHQESHGTPEAGGAFDLCWEPKGWWLSIVMPGHYAFERDGRQDLPLLIGEAVAYYGASVPLWEKGCQQHHPLAAPTESTS